MKRTSSIEYSSCVKLWAAVLNQAKSDATANLEVKYPRTETIIHTTSAIKFLSIKNEFFCRLCFLLDKDPQRLINNLNKNYKYIYNKNKLNL